ncbi:MAG TPA: transposase [Alcanivorax sp.]|jgi:putative transposase|nr:transposase [Alcanivorax sp.]
MPRKARSHRLRIGRVSESGRVYLITITCHQRRAHFAALQSGRCFVQALRACTAHAVTLSYVVMPDHVHWLMALREHADLSITVQKAKSLTTQRWRRAGRGDNERLWHAGFHDRALRREDDLVAMARYIVANPLRAGLVNDIGDYPHWDSAWLL